MSEQLNYEILAAQLNTRFALADAAEPFEIELVEITKPTVTASQTFFSAYFRGEKFILPQATYRLSHDALGEIFLFLVPIEQTADAVKYEAVFNLLNEGKETKN